MITSINRVKPSRIIKRVNTGIERITPHGGEKKLA